MQASRRIILFFFSAFFYTASQAQVDTMSYRADTVDITETDMIAWFFEKNEQVTDPGKTILVTKAKKTTSLTSFLKGLGSFAAHAVADLDNDGKKELVIMNYTGGAHCCDELYVFRNAAPNKYQHVARLFAGNTIISDSNKFYYDLHEQFGYFFTCYACFYQDTADEAPIRVSRIEIKYNKGVLGITRGDQELRSKINDNLAKLGEQPYEKLDPD